MKKNSTNRIIAASFVALALPAASMAQTVLVPFTNQTSLLTTTSYSSGNCIGVVDMNNDGKDDIVRTNNTDMNIQFQGTPNGAFTGNTYTYGLSSPWGMCVGDVNNDGINDVLWGDNGAVRMMTWNGSTFVGSNLTTICNSGYVFTQGANFFDIDNDSYLDAFVCADTDTNHIFMNQSGTGWTFNPWAIPPGCGVPGSGNSFDGSGNYASIFTDINNDNISDLFVTHCRQSVTNPSDYRRIDQVYINNGNGTFTQDVTNWTGLKDGAQGWSTAFGDIDNDGDLDAFILNYDVNSQLMRNDGSGVFTNIMSGSGINNTTTIFGENATFQDFNNDGYTDLMITGDTHLMYINNGDGTFTLSGNPFVNNSYQMTAHAVGDLNGDGFLDVYASYCDIYNTPNNTKRDRLWMNDAPNQGNSNNWIKFNLVGGATAGMSNKNGVGAVIKIYGPWGTQVRVVHAGQAYGIQFSMTQHFGLGANTAIDSVIVHWPSGIVDQMLTLPAGQTYTINEGGSPTSTALQAVHPLNVSVAPNPMDENGGVIQIVNFESFGLENLSLTIMDVNGKLIYSENKLQRSIIPVDQSQLSSGMYFYEVRKGSERLAGGKFIRK